MVYLMVAAFVGMALFVMDGVKHLEKQIIVNIPLVKVGGK